MNPLPQEESLTIEFKSDQKKIHDSVIIETVVGLANSSGGSLYVGIEDNGTVTGLHSDRSDPQRLVALIRNKTMPPVDTIVEEIDVDDKRVAHIKVQTSSQIIATIEGKVLKRRLKQDGSPETSAMFAFEFTDRLASQKRYDYSSECLPSACMNDLDPRERERMRELISIGNEQALNELDDEALDKALGLAKEIQGNLSPTVTGLLLIGKAQRLQELLPTVRAALQVFDGIKLKINEHSSRPLLETLATFESTFKYCNPEEEFQQGLLRVGVPQFSPIAFREALINAFSHRDYTILQEVRLVINDEALSISSPGGFVEGVGLHNILTVEPLGRNPTLALALKRIGLAEKSGRGIDRIFEGSINYGRPWPDYSESSSHYVKVRIPRGKPDMAFHEMLQQHSGSQALPITALLILSALKEYRRLNIKRLLSVTSLSENQIRSEIERLVEMALVEASGTGRMRDYILSREVYAIENNLPAYETQLKSSNSKRRDLILDFAKRHQGMFTSSDVANHLVIDRAIVTKEIKKLVDQGLLAKSGDTRGSKYQIIE